MTESSLEHLVRVVDEAAGRLRELRTENTYLKEEIRRLELELGGLREELGVRRDEAARLRGARDKVRVLAERALDRLAKIETSSDEVNVGS